MTRRLVIAVMFAALPAAAAWFLIEYDSPRQRDEPLRVGDVLGAVPNDGFALALSPRRFSFPQDHGPHPDFQTEWWYFTGNLTDTQGRSYGFQLTLFRYALAPDVVNSRSRWRDGQVYMGHFAVSDIQAATFSSAERISRAGPDIAGSRADPVRVWVQDWVIEYDTVDKNWSVHARTEALSLTLNLESTKAMVLQGEAGLSRKSARPGNASYYYSATRMRARGELAIDGRAQRVAGQAWLDREWGTSALDADQVGWDWFGLQLSDGSELMFYRIRSADGRSDPASAGTLVRADGSVLHLGVRDLQIEEERTWTSSATEATYPARWRLQGPDGLDLTVTPRLADQELDLTVRYWEGAVAAAGHLAGRAVRGVGFVELTGYGPGRSGPRIGAR